LLGGTHLANTPSTQTPQAPPPGWPKGKFSGILADWPSIFKTYSEKGKGRSAERHYKCMEVGDVCALPVANLAASNCVLFMWTTWVNLKASLTIIEAWGFKYKTVGFVWVKERSCGRLHFGMGKWTRANTEVCLLATKGKPRRIAANVRQVIISPLREHSRKPDEIYPRIERLISGPFCELFARHRRPGWASWGDELPCEEVTTYSCGSK
jgi:N6-adenosine-specific RNA methylase IME4